MIEKLSEYKITSRDGSFINVECNTKIINTLVRKLNELVDAVNQLVSCEQARTCYELIHKNEEPADLQKENSDLKDELERIKETLFEAKYALEEVITPSVISHEQALAQQALDKINAEINNIGADNE